jgi:citrate synthase
LHYAGYDIADLAEYSRFEETLWLLWHGELPAEQELQALCDDLAANLEPRAAMWDVVADAPETDLPGAQPAVARRIESVLGFVVCRTEVAQCRGPALTVVEALDVLKDRAPRGDAGWASCAGGGGRA